MSDKLPLTSPDPKQERFEALKAVMPEVFSEGKLDLERLKLFLGERVETGRERYGLSWAGKSEAIRAVQVQSHATLRPVWEESVNFDESQNLILEGDNFEALKLLQFAYHHAVKLIYIDPPYNTGSEFIYSDDFSDPMHEYLVYTGQIQNGVKTSSTMEGAGRFHSRWLTMLYPRLQLAKSLLKEDGAIFVSIDDHEVHSLRQIMDELFGRENFITTLIWQKVYSPKNSAIHFSGDHDYIVVYARDADKWRPTLLPRTDEANARYENTDDDKRGAWKPADMTARNYYSEGQYEVTSPSGKKFTPSRGRYWAVSSENFERLDGEGRIWWGRNGDAMPQQKRFLSEVKQGAVPQTLWKYEDVGHTQEAKRELIAHTEYEETDNVLDSVKPTRLIRRILQVGTNPNSEDIVLDFFAGSGTTGHAVLTQNAEDEGNRRFILVQFPERLYTPESKLKTIADVTRARVRKVIENLRASLDNGLALHNGAGLGFRSFHLSTSNFKQWDGENPDLAGQLEALIDNLEPGRSQEDVLFELLLKAGYPLSVKYNTLELEGQTVYSVNEGRLLVCLERHINEATLRAMMREGTEQVLCLDVAFDGDDALKTNIVLEMRDKGILFRTT